jgi:hypothetical protein
MANNIKLSSSLEAIINDSKTVGSKSYTIKSVDKNVGSLGGSYTQTYESTAAEKHTGVLANTAFTVVTTAVEGSPVGTAPDQVKAIAMSHDSEIGSAGTVDIEITQTGDHTTVTSPTDSGGAVVLTGGTTTLKIVVARLLVGESCVIPLSDTDGSGLPVANIKIKDAGYVDNTKESTVTVILIGDTD